MINLPDSVKEYLRIRLMRSIEMIQNTQLRVWIQVLASTRGVVGCLVQAKKNKIQMLDQTSLQKQNLNI
jgi:hypothetical protein